MKTSNTFKSRFLIGLIVSGVTGMAVASGGCGSDSGSAAGSSGGSSGDGGTSGSSGSSGTFGSSGASGANGEGGAGSSGTSGGASSSGSSGDDVACQTATAAVQKSPIDMMIGLDTSLSMDFDDKWINVRDALKLFVGNPKYVDLGVGLQFFPIRKQCDADAYKDPAVPLQLIAQSEGPIIQALDAQEMAGGTPMVPLLQGLTSYLASNAQPNRKPVLVLATDGFPDDNCLDTAGGAMANTFDNAIAVAKAAFEGTPSVPTFVIGVGTELTALDDIAAAGGTTAATLVDTSAGVDTQAAFVTALDNIRKRAIPCTYAIPNSGAIDPHQTNVSYTPGGGTAEQLVFVGSDSDCTKAPTNGWYFDNPTNPTEVILCAATCNVVKEDDLGQVSLVFGCPRVDVK